MPRKRKRLKGALADFTRFALKLTTVASDGIPVPGLKGATGGVSHVWDKIEARKSNLDDERQARDRGKRLHDQLRDLEDGQLDPDQVSAFRRKLELCIDQLPDLIHKSKFEQFIAVDKNAREIAACHAALDRLHREIELALVSKIRSDSRTIHAQLKAAHEDSQVLQNVAQSQECIKHEMRVAREVSESAATLQSQDINSLKREVRKMRLILAGQVFLFRLVG